MGLIEWPRTELHFGRQQYKGQIRLYHRGKATELTFCSTVVTVTYAQLWVFRNTLKMSHCVPDKSSDGGRASFTLKSSSVSFAYCDVVQYTDFTMEVFTSKIYSCCNTHVNVIFFLVFRKILHFLCRVLRSFEVLLSIICKFLTPSFIHIWTRMSKVRTEIYLHP